MLDEYKDTNKILYNILTNSIRINKISHAYLIETKGNCNGLNLALAFSKSILCPMSNTKKEKCSDCQICQMIEDGNYPDIKIINPDGQWIKKEQLLTLQKEYNKKSIMNNKKIYIINGAEYLNEYSANTMLKFLEEPAPNIIAILLCERESNVLKTIKSRCQIISMVPKKEELNNIIEKIGSLLFNSDEELYIYQNDKKSYEDYIKVLDFINKYETEGKKVLLDINKNWFKSFPDKEKNNLALTIMLIVYKDSIDNVLKNTNIIDNKEFEVINNILKNNNPIQLCDKINIILNSIEKNKYNANVNLNIDKMILEMEKIK